METSSETLVGILNSTWTNWPNQNSTWTGSSNQNLTAGLFNWIGDNWNSWDAWSGHGYQGHNRTASKPANQTGNVQTANLTLDEADILNGTDYETDTTLESD